MARTGWLLGCMAVLAGLDLAGALLAQQYAQRHQPLALVLGALMFVVLFVVYAFSLEYAQLSIVTMGWVVLLQVSLIGIDLTRGQLHLDRNQALASLAILVLQCYLIVSTETSPAAAVRLTQTPTIPYLDPGMDLVADEFAPLTGAVSAQQMSGEPKLPAVGREWASTSLSGTSTVVSGRRGALAVAAAAELTRDEAR